MNQARHPSLSIVVPLHNEEDNIRPLVESLFGVLASDQDFLELLLVDDGSEDSTRALARQLAGSDHRIRLITHDRNRGLGAAIRSGLAEARGDLILYTDADLPFDFHLIPQIVALAGDDRIVVGCRANRGDGLRRYVLSKGYNLLCRAVLGLRVRDVNFACKLIPRRALAGMRLLSEGSFIDAELLVECRRQAMRVVEVPLTYHARVRGLSTLSRPRVIAGILREMARYVVASARSRDGRRSSRVRRRLIINADDYGRCAEVNAAVEQLAAAGLLGGLSVLANGDCWEPAAAFLRDHPELSAGVHLNAVEGRPVSAAPEVALLTDAGGSFVGVVPLLRRWVVRPRAVSRALEREWRAQIERLLAAGVRLTHADSHRHLHALPGAYHCAVKLCEEYGIPALRQPRENGLNARRLAGSLMLHASLAVARASAPRTTLRQNDHFLGFKRVGAYGAAELIQDVRKLPAGLTELAVHPSTEDHVPYPALCGNQERRALLDDGMRAEVTRLGIELTTWEVARRAGQNGWDTYWDEDREFWEVLRRAEAEDYVGRLTAAVALDPHARVLDFGCGSGLIAQLLAPKVAEICLWDPAPGVRRRAQLNVAKHPNVRVLDLTDPEPLRRALSFDLILVNSVAQYMTAGQLAFWLAWWRDALSPEGRLVLSDLIPPGARAGLETLALLKFSARHGFLVRAFWEGLREVRRYSAVRHAYPLYRIGRDELRGQATAAGLTVRFLSSNLTYHQGRLTAVLSGAAGTPAAP